MTNIREKFISVQKFQIENDTILLRSRFIPRVHGDERTLVKCNYWVARKIELAKRGVYSIRKMDESMVRWFFFFFFLTIVPIIILRTIFVNVIFEEITWSHLFCDRLLQLNEKFKVWLDFVILENIFPSCTAF